MVSSNSITISFFKGKTFDFFFLVQWLRSDLYLLFPRWQPYCPHITDLTTYLHQDIAHSTFCKHLYILGLIPGLILYISGLSAWSPLLLPHSFNYCSSKMLQSHYSFWILSVIQGVCFSVWTVQSTHLSLKIIFMILIILWSLYRWIQGDIIFTMLNLSM